MGFELFFVVPEDRSPPHPDRLEEVLSRLPFTTRSKEKSRGYLLHYEYLNPETGVVCDFRFTRPGHGDPMFRGWTDSGLSFQLPYLCPTFFAREAMPMVERVARAFDFKLLAMKGETPPPQAGVLQRLWQDTNRRTVEVLAKSSSSLPPFYPQERLDDVWRYMNERHQLETRYAAKGLYVPRIIFIRNKLSRNKVFMAAMWTELNPALIPDVDAFVVNKPARGFLGLPTGRMEPVVVKAPAVLQVIQPHLRAVERPIPHKLLEEVGPHRRALTRALRAELTPRFVTFETVGYEEIIDVPI